MKILKVIYDDDTKFILDIVRNLPVKVYLEEYTISDYRQKKKALPILTRHGTGNVPLIVFEDENLEEISAIWSEENPNWKEAILEHLSR